MSRSGYTDEADSEWAAICWRGAVKSAINGKRGQAFLRELAATMDAMPKKRLIAHELQANGEHCSLGVVGHARGIDMTKLNMDWDSWDWSGLAKAFGISEALAREIMYHNDEGLYPYGSKQPTEEDRWKYMREWIDRKLVKASQ